MLLLAATLAGGVLMTLTVVVVMQQFALRSIHRELDRREETAAAWLIQVESQRLERAKGLEDAIRGISLAARGEPRH